MLISKASVRFCKYTCGRLAQVFYKATELMNDQILMTGFAPGGLSQVPQSFFRTASLSAPLAQEQGIFGIKPEVLACLRALGLKLVCLSMTSTKYTMSRMPEEKCFTVKLCAVGL